ncbi:MAG: hypothetical protein L0215_07915 [Gemmataceae bacterium]|nr:hypothetical protein [Gemmataceae bacterium]
MRLYWVSLACGLLLAAEAQGQYRFSGDSSEPEKVPVVKLSLQPAKAPVPALKYALLPEVRDLRPGNAALLYQRAHAQEWWGFFYRMPEAQKIHEWREMPLRKMPAESVKKVLPTGALREIDLAARREFCDWELTERARLEGPGLHLPDVQGFRTYAELLALRARLDMLEGRLDKALNGLQTGLAMSQHIAQAPIIVNNLVALATSQVMVNQVEDFIQLPGAPNLYWSLVDLPRPFIDLRRALQGEKVMVESMFPAIRDALRDPEHPPLPAEIITKQFKSLAHFADGQAPSPLSLAVSAARIEPQARKHFLAKGWAAERLDKLPVNQVALMYSVALYDRYYDDMYKWHSLPYWEARAGLRKATEDFAAKKQSDADSAALTAQLLPAVNNILFARARLDRRVALLTVVEALRLHGAAHDGKLPDRLEDIRQVPVPSDPVTGKAFEYGVTNGVATLYAPPPAGEIASERSAVRYEITLRK